MRHFVFVCLAVLGVSSRASATDIAGIKVTWLGHATFEVVSPGGTTVLIDPFVTNNPMTPVARKDLATYKPSVILVSHSHPDHASDAVAIAKQSGAPVISVHEWVVAQKLPEKQSLGGNVGGTFTIGDVRIYLVPAMHSSEPGGRPLGFILKFADDRTLYHTGDTWAFGDMSLIQELHKPSILLFNMGGGPYVQDPKTAATIIGKYFKPKVIVPMHYGTFPGLATEADVKAAFSKDKRLRILVPGETTNL